jgi:signal transduction histidine kinase
MQIRTRLTLLFLLLGGVIMIIASVAIYYSSANFRKEDFYNRLRNQSRSTARLILDPYAPDPNLARIIENDNPTNLQNKRIIILNNLNDTLYSSDETGEIKVTNEILEKIRSDVRVTYKQGAFEILGTLYTVKSSPFVVIAAATDSQGLLHLRKLRTILLVVCLLSLLMFFIAGWFYSGRALKPISDVVKKVEDISITSLNLRVNEGNGTDEIGRLAKTFNKMLERLETSFATQKDFIANASHEMRTPLTSINGQLEVLMMKDRSKEEYKAAVGSVLEDIRSLIDLLNRLLLIARTSSESPENYNKKIRIDEVLWQAQEEMKRFNPEFRINISLDNSLTDSDQMTVVGDEYLLKVSVSNVIENACKYSPDHSVDIKFAHTEKWIEVIFEDKGIGISKEDIGKIFEPFYRGANSNSVPGSGIGLSLVNRIIKNHNGIVKLSSQVGKGTTVIINLPSFS